MLTSRLLRHIQCHRGSLSNIKVLSQSFCSDSSDDEKKIKQKPKSTQQPSSKKSEDALKKLNLLLKQMLEEDHTTTSNKNLNLARPKQRAPKKKEEKEPARTDILAAAKDVAQSLGGDVQKTESELLNKLLNPSETPDDESKTAKKPLNLSEVISGMKIDRTVKPVQTEQMGSRAHQVRQVLDHDELRKTKEQIGLKRRRPRLQPVRTEMEKIELFSGEGLGIFTKSTGKYKDEQPTLKTWEMLQQRELQLAITHPPTNYFQEMILWTNQGKLWKFPIDNEQGMEEEQNVYFAEHVFLDKHLEPWCPPKGPIRHFMELVCVGLSKNPYITVQAKKDHIDWFKNYFSSKDSLLREIGAIPADFKNIKELDG